VLERTIFLFFRRSFVDSQLSERGVMDRPSTEEDLIHQCISLNDVLSKERAAEKRRGITASGGEWIAVNDTHIKIDRVLKRVIDTLHVRESRAILCEKWTHEDILRAFLSPVVQGEPSSVLCNRYARALSLSTLHKNALWSGFFHKALEELKKTGQKDTIKRIGILYVIQSYFEGFTEFRPQDTKSIAGLISLSELLSMFQKMVRAGGAFTVDVRKILSIHVFSLLFSLLSSLLSSLFSSLFSLSSINSFKRELCDVLGGCSVRRVSRIAIHGSVVWIRFSWWERTKTARMDHKPSQVVFYIPILIEDRVTCHG
jgi:hypothetical protein